MNRLNSVFLTHFHSGHIAALPDVNLTTWVRGRKTSRPVYRAQGIVTDAIAWQDELMTVTAFSPEIGHRVDYRGRSVVISGDTNASDSLLAAARDADLLLHAALGRPLLDPMIAAAEAASVPVMPTIMKDVIDYHADSTSLEARAAEAGVAQLALYHLVPAPISPLASKLFKRGLSPDIIIASDLQTFDFTTGSKEIVIQNP